MPNSRRSSPTSGEVYHQLQTKEHNDSRNLKKEKGEKVLGKMHSHLHTPENISASHTITVFCRTFRLIRKLVTDCEEIMNALDECHSRGFLWKAMGQCNDIKRDVNRCLGAERAKRAKQNRDQAMERRARVEKLWAEERLREQGETLQKQ